jgi:hypothetical protein
MKKVIYCKRVSRADPMGIKCDWPSEGACPCCFYCSDFKKCLDYHLEVPAWPKAFVCSRVGPYNYGGFCKTFKQLTNVELFLVEAGKLKIDIRKAPSM